MQRILISIAIALACTSALAETAANSGSQSTAQASPQNIGNPIVNVNGTPTAPITAARVDNNVHTNQAATPGTVFVNPPAADTCAKPGSGLAVQAPGGGAAVTIGGGESAKCDMRADTINLKVTGAPQSVIKSRQCMDPQMAEAYARAGEPCVDQRPQQRAEAAPAAQVTAANTTDPYIAARLAR